MPPRRWRSSGITAASLSAIALNILFNIIGTSRTHPSSTAEAASHAPEPADIH
ncbi:hypothetical protein [Deinococcus wulumuqiensis]|uniref:hypothetical protein n=1 Tax=Deinococcus wulumuqiensis TaxID=980427 RepID=UPI0013C2E39E|nr:hypothetical protein [Deinococcus wulumuqiensis]